MDIKIKQYYQCYANYKIIFDIIIDGFSIHFFLSLSLTHTSIFVIVFKYDIKYSNFILENYNYNVNDYEVEDEDADNENGGDDNDNAVKVIIMIMLMITMRM